MSKYSITLLSGVLLGLATGCGPATSGPHDTVPVLAGQGPPPPAGAEPVQAALNPVLRWRKGDYIFRGQAIFRAHVRLLHTARYRFDAGARLAPMDFAVGWNEMARPEVYQALDISQRWRWYQYEYSGAPPIDPRAISRNSSNIHLVPADDAVWRKLKSFHRGNLIYLEGILVYISGPDGWQWLSSLSRNDTGDGACELLWVIRAETDAS